MQNLLLTNWIECNRLKQFKKILKYALKIYSIEQLDERKQEVNIDVIINEHWIDENMKKKQQIPGTLLVDPSSDLIWKPNTIIAVS